MARNRGFEVALQHTFAKARVMFFDNNVITELTHEAHGSSWEESIWRWRKVWWVTELRMEWRLVVGSEIAKVISY